MYSAWKIWYKKQVTKQIQARFTLADLCIEQKKGPNKLSLHIKLHSLNASVNLALKTAYSIDIVSMETISRHMPPVKKTRW